MHDRAQQPLRVLAADDEHDCLESLRILLELWGHEVRTARDGIEALEAAETFRPQVAILDIEMPRLHGAEVARRLRQSSADVFLIAATAACPNDERLRGYEGVFDVFLRKPYRVEQLKDLLDSRSHAVPQEKKG